MDKQGSAPPSYEVAMGGAPGFIPPQPMPVPHHAMPMPHHGMPMHHSDYKPGPFPVDGSTPADFYPPPAHTQTVTQVVIQQTIQYGDKCQPVNCPHCKHDIITRIEVEPSTQTHLCALLMCAFGIWPCCCLPYCIDSCQKINHYCPNCGTFLGSYQN